jgi:hypothetical protein
VHFGNSRRTTSKPRNAGLTPGALLLLAALAAAATPVEVARSEAESNAKTPAGKRYEGVLVSRAEEWLRPALERCARDLPESERISFDGLVRVSSQGKPEEVLFGPSTELARCVAPDFREASYPKPPQPSWWVKIVVRLK